MKYYLIAGERSGDLHASNLAKELKKLDTQAHLRGFGGDFMAAAGVEIAVHYSDIAVMGFWEVITNLNKISRYLGECKNDILSFNPDVIILVDFGGFNKRIAAWAKKQSIKVFYYISPKVWAWNQKRAIKLKATVDKMFVILPFEKGFYKRFDWDVDYVGNPVLDAVKDHSEDLEFASKHKFPADVPVVALLPGSRKQEVAHMATVMNEVVGKNPEIHFAVATVNNLDESIYVPFKGSNVSFIKDDTYNLLLNSSAAVVTSGTATLETALFRVPQVVVYKTSNISYRIAKALIQVPFISLVNLVAEREVVTELIQNDYTAENVSRELKDLLSAPRRKQMLKDYDEIYYKLNTGSASVNAARLIYTYLG